MTTIQEMARHVSEKVWGFFPSRQIKPVHVANGFFKALCGQPGTPAKLQKVAGGFRSGKSDVTTEELIRELGKVLDISGRSSARDRVNDLRTALDLVLSQDRSLYSGGPFTVTLTHRLHVSTDPSDMGAGKFLAGLLAGDDYNRSVDVLRDCLEKKTDNVYTLTAPLLQDREIGPLPQPLADLDMRLQSSPVLASIQAGFGVLSRHAPLLEKTEFLQRVVALGCFSLYLSLVNRTTSNGDRVPLLLCAPVPIDKVRDASRATYVRAKLRIRRAFAEAFRVELEARQQHEMSLAEYKVLFTEWLPEYGQVTTEGKKSAKIWRQFEQDLDSYAAGSSALDAFVQAAVPAIFMGLLESPPEVGTTIGRLSGLVYPRQQGSGEKYLLPTPGFLDMLVTALVEPEEEVIVTEFWDRAWTKFGLLCGAKGSLDAQRLAHVGIRQTSPAQLEENAKSMVLQLVAMGHAQQLPDDVAVIRGMGRQRS